MGIIRKRGGLFDRLMGRSVFAQPDGVVGVDEYRGDFHQRGHPQCVAGVFREHQEGGAVRLEAAVQDDAVHDGGHAEFTDAVVDVVAVVAGGVDVFAA